LIKGENNRGEDEPVNVEIEDEEEDKSGHSSQGGEERSGKQEVGIDLLHYSFLLWGGRKYKKKGI